MDVRSGRREEGREEKVVIVLLLYIWYLRANARVHCTIFFSSILLLFSYIPFWWTKQSVNPIHKLRNTNDRLTNVHYLSLWTLNDAFLCVFYFSFSLTHSFSLSKFLSAFSLALSPVQWNCFTRTRTHACLFLSLSFFVWGFSEIYSNFFWCFWIA